MGSRMKLVYVYEFVKENYLHLCFRVSVWTDRFVNAEVTCSAHVLNCGLVPKHSRLIDISVANHSRTSVDEIT